MGKIIKTYREGWASCSMEWNGSMLNTKAGQETIMRDCAIKWVPDSLSGVWWATVPELRGFEANQPPRREGPEVCDRWNPLSLRQEEGNHQAISMCYYSHTPHPTFDSEIKVYRRPGKHWVEENLAGGCNHRKCSKNTKRKEQERKMLVL